MKLRITMIDWKYPDDGKTPSPEVLDLAEKSHVMILYMSLANGAIVEMKAEADSEEALGVLRGLIQGAGSGVRADLSAQEKATRIDSLRMLPKTQSLPHQKCYPPSVFSTSMEKDHEAFDEPTRPTRTHSIHRPAIPPGQQNRQEAYPRRANRRHRLSSQVRYPIAQQPTCQSLTSKPPAATRVSTTTRSRWHWSSSGKPPTGSVPNAWCRFYPNSSLRSNDMGIYG